MKRLTINEIARISGVSRTTVSRVLNKSPLVHQETANTVNEVIDRLKYQPSELARGLRSKETKTIGVIVTNILNPFFTSIVRGVEDVANRYNYNIIICNTDESYEKETQYCNVLVSKHVDGLIIASTGKKYDPQDLTDGIPIVFIDRSPKGLENQFDTILVNNQEGSYQIVKHLLETGYRRIGLIGGFSQLSTGYERLMGYRQAHKEYGIKIDENLIKSGDFLGHTSYRQAMEVILKSNCDAIYAMNNMILHGVMKALKELKVRVPLDIGLATFDDLEWMEHCGISITAVKQPAYEIGTMAMNMLLDRISGSVVEAKSVMLDVVVNIRESTQRKNGENVN